MGNISLNKELNRFITDRIRYRDRYYLSEIMCEWVWGTDGLNIWKWALSDELIFKEDPKNVIDMMYLCRRVRRHRGVDEITDEQERRLSLFLIRRREGRIGRHIIYTDPDSIKTNDYITITSVHARK